MKITGLLLDGCDTDLLRHKWLLSKEGYVRRSSFFAGAKSTILLHREILARIIGRKLNTSDHTDHLNRNKLDNRRCNLRLATRSENQGNRSKVKRPTASRFIGLRRVGGKWGARIQVRTKDIWLGVYATEVEAAAAYNRAAAEHGFLTRNDLV